MKNIGKGHEPPSAPKRILSLIAIGFLSGNSAVLAQESPGPSDTSGSSPEIIGTINTGENLANLSARGGSSDRARARTRFQPIAPPRGKPEGTPTADAGPAQKPLPDSLAGEQGRQFLFPVEANRHPNGLFLVKVHHRGQVHSFWSNIDWQNLDVISGIRDRGDSFHFLLFVRTVDPSHPDNEGHEENPGNLPALAEKGPFFTLAAGTNEREIPPEILNFLEATHQLYHEREADLVEATTKRQANRARFRQRQRGAARKAPEAPDDIVVQFWHSKPKPLPPHLRRTGRKETDR